MSQKPIQISLQDTTAERDDPLDRALLVVIAAAGQVQVQVAARRPRVAGHEPEAELGAFARQQDAAAFVEGGASEQVRPEPCGRVRVLVRDREGLQVQGHRLTLDQWQTPYRGGPPDLP